MTELITPAQAHDKKYPRPILQPTVLGDKQQAELLYARLDFDNSVGGELTLPTGNYVVLTTDLNANVNTIHLSERNFHPTSGLCVIRLVTSSSYEAGNGVINFNLPTANYQVKISANQSYFLTFSLVKQRDGVSLILVSKIVE